MVHNLSGYFAPEGSIPLEGCSKIRWNDYQVCQLLGPYVLAAVNWIERCDLPVRKVVITPFHVLAYFPDYDPEAMFPEYIEIKLPKGLYERAQDLSAGPLSPFPVEGPSEEVQLFLGRLQRLAFPDVKEGAEVKHIILNATNYAEVRRWLSKQHDSPCSVELLKTGFMGHLSEFPLSEGRLVSVWVSKAIPKGSVGSAVFQPPPNWEAPGKMKVHAWE